MRERLRIHPRDSCDRPAKTDRHSSRSRHLNGRINAVKATPGDPGHERKVISCRPVADLAHIEALMKENQVRRLSVTNEKGGLLAQCRSMTC